jgi:hypothetical protein
MTLFLGANHGIFMPSPMHQAFERYRHFPNFRTLTVAASVAGTAEIRAECPRLPDEELEELSEHRRH